MKLSQNALKNLFTIGAIVGVAVTGYLAAKNGEKICDACRLVNEETRSMDKPAKIKHFVKNTPYLAKRMWKPVLAGSATYACMIASHKISGKQIAALTATCAYLTRNRDFLEKKLKETVGEETFAKIKKEFVAQEIVKEKIVWGGPSVERSSYCIEDEDDGVLCLEGYSGRWFRCPKERVLEAQKMLQHLFEDEIYCCMNDYYAFLGITMTQYGHEKGWVNHEDYYHEIHFTNTLLTPEEWGDYGPDGEYVNEDVFVLEIDTFPMECWQEI